MQREPLNSLLWHAKRKSSEIIRDGFFSAGGCRQGIVMMGSAGHECNSPLTLIANASSPHAPRHLHHAARCWPGRSIASKLRRGGERGGGGSGSLSCAPPTKSQLFYDFHKGIRAYPDSARFWLEIVFGVGKQPFSLNPAGFCLHVPCPPPSHYGPPWPAHSAAHHTAAASVFHAVTPFRAMTL